MDDIEKIAIGTIFAILQALILGVIAAAVKTYWNVRTLKRDMNEAFRMIRELKHLEPRGNTYDHDNSECR